MTKDQVNPSKRIVDKYRYEKVADVRMNGKDKEKTRCY